MAPPPAIPAAATATPRSPEEPRPAVLPPAARAQIASSNRTANAFLGRRPTWLTAQRASAAPKPATSTTTSATTSTPTSSTAPAATTTIPNSSSTSSNNLNTADVLPPIREPDQEVSAAPAADPMIIPSSQPDPSQVSDSSLLSPAPTDEASPENEDKNDSPILANVPLPNLRPGQSQTQVAVFPIVRVNQVRVVGLPRAEAVDDQIDDDTESESHENVSSTVAQPSEVPVAGSAPTALAPWTERVNTSAGVLSESGAKVSTLEKSSAEHTSVLQTTDQSSITKDGHATTSAPPEATAESSRRPSAFVSGLARFALIDPTPSPPTVESAPNTAQEISQSVTTAPATNSTAAPSLPPTAVSTALAGLPLPEPETTTAPQAVPTQAPAPTPEAASAPPLAATATPAQAPVTVIDLESYAMTASDPAQPSSGTTSYHPRLPATIKVPPMLFKYADYIPFIHEKITDLSSQQRLSNEVEVPRLSIIVKACEEEDGFFILLHQVFCLWTVNRRTCYQTFQRLDSSVVDGAFRILELIFKSNELMRPSLRTWMAEFPRSIASMMAEQTPHTHNLSKVAIFLRRLVTNWESIRMSVQRRGHPILMDELVTRLFCLSPILQTIIFTSSRRQIGIPNGNHGAAIEKLFHAEQQRQTIGPGLYVGLPTVLFDNVERYNSEIIEAYRKIVSQCRLEAQAAQNAAAAAAAGQRVQGQAGPAQPNQQPMTWQQQQQQRQHQQVHQAQAHAQASASGIPNPQLLAEMGSIQPQPSAIRPLSQASTRPTSQHQHRHHNSHGSNHSDGQIMARLGQDMRQGHPEMLQAAQAPAPVSLSAFAESMAHQQILPSQQQAMNGIPAQPRPASVSASASTPTGAHESIASLEAACNVHGSQLQQLYKMQQTIQLQIQQLRQGPQTLASTPQAIQMQAAYGQQLYLLQQQIRQTTEMFQTCSAQLAEAQRVHAATGQVQGQAQAQANHLQANPQAQGQAHVLPSQLQMQPPQRRSSQSQAHQYLSHDQQQLMQQQLLHLQMQAQQKQRQQQQEQEQQLQQLQQHFSPQPTHQAAHPVQTQQPRPQQYQQHAAPMQSPTQQHHFQTQQQMHQQMQMQMQTRQGPQVHPQMHQGYPQPQGQQSPPLQQRPFAVPSQVPNQVPSQAPTRVVQPAQTIPNAARGPVNNPNLHRASVGQNASAQPPNRAQPTRPSASANFVAGIMHGMQPPAPTQTQPQPQQPVQPQYQVQPQSAIQQQRQQTEQVNQSVAAAQRQAAAPSKPSAARHSIFPSSRAVIPLGDYPHDPNEKRSVAMSLALARCRSPVRVLLDTATKQELPAEPARERFYQFVQRMPVGPTPTPARLFTYNLEFFVTEEEYALRAPKLMIKGELLPVEAHKDGCLQYRVRCCKGRPNGSTPTESEWVVMKTTWPTNIFMKVNNVVVTARRKTHNGRDLPADITGSVRIGVNKLQVVISAPSAQSANAKLFMMGVEVVQTASHQRVMSQIEKYGIQDASVTLNEIMRRLQSSTSDDDDFALVQEDLSVDLADPFSARIFNTPVRGAQCQHIECFDLENWLKTRPSKPAAACQHIADCRCPKNPEPTLPDKWQCPICSRDARPSSLRVDQFLVDVRKTLEETGKIGKVKSILVAKDGTWKPVVDTDDDSGSDGEGGGNDNNAGEGSTQDKGKKRAAGSPAVGGPPNKTQRVSGPATGTASRRVTQAIEIIDLDSD